MQMHTGEKTWWALHIITTVPTRSQSHVTSVTPGLKQAGDMAGDGPSHHHKPRANKRLATHRTNNTPTWPSAVPEGHQSVHRNGYQRIGVVRPGTGKKPTCRPMSYDSGPAPQDSRKRPHHLTQLPKPAAVPTQTMAQLMSRSRCAQVQLRGLLIKRRAEVHRSRNSADLRTERCVRSGRGR